ncbi:glycosyltransferase family 2 protein [Candidatus Odyssella acanthamoebae]|uniref:Glycosyltransferase 2-like domain-containing protein n=1 Tax=Candidatus Odyssella acanthamoebae TaxID=91604 RepID=A0A077AUV9_9PROT|nr:glycosyltransferase [Candidatus Paracaedibacter acanthamoebae]AIK96942.1 hypothetical protein ID47_09710 [Candidatus Paracaedibacter acanthamoebae]
MPKISVILPVYNGEDYLEASIQSVRDQTFIDFELIIIDDCSQDSSSHIAQEFAKIDPRIKYFRNETNLKLPRALNRGFSLARGDYWTWTSCDNTYKPLALETLAKYLDNQPEIDFVYSDMDLINEMDQITDFISAGPASDIIFRNVVGACFMYRRQIGEQIGLYNDALFLCEDYEYWLRIALQRKILPIHENLYRYRRHTKSLSEQHQQKIIARGLSVQRKFAPLFLKSRKDFAVFYAHVRARDVFNPFRQLYLLYVLYYSPTIFFKELLGLIKRRFL